MLLPLELPMGAPALRTLCRQLGLRELASSYLLAVLLAILARVQHLCKRTPFRLRRVQSAGAGVSGSLQRGAG